MLANVASKLADSPLAADAETDVNVLEGLVAERETVAGAAVAAAATTLAGWLAPRSLSAIRFPPVCGA